MGNWTRCWNHSHGIGAFLKCLFSPTPAPPIPPEPPVPPIPPPPEPPVLPKSDIPYHKTGKLLVVADACLTLACTRDSDTFKASDIPDYLNSCVLDGVNAIRSVSQFNDETPGKWESWKVAEIGYEDHLRQIMTWVKERDLTLILCLQPYGDRTPMPTNLYQSLIYLAQSFAPNVIIEPENEPQDMTIANIVVPMAKAMGVPNSHLQVEWVDAGEYFDMVKDTLNGEGISCLHFYASMDSINAPWPKGWTTSENSMMFVRVYGLYPSTDGGLDGHDGQFPWWTDPTWHCASPQDAYEMCRWNLSEGGRGLELLSKSMFSTDFPNVALSIEGGRAERQAMRRAYDVV